MRFRFWRRFLGPPKRKSFDFAEVAQACAEAMPAWAPFPDWGKEAFLRTLPERCAVLDVGCGNDSPYLTKEIRPNCHYVGVDVGDYNQTRPNLADEYVLTAPETFTEAIVALGERFEAAICAHNLEHCNDRGAVLKAIAGALKPGGRAYIAFPSADSVEFPSRAGTLNYSDDEGHRDAPPDFAQTVTSLAAQGLRIAYATSRYQPPMRWLIGLASERASAEARRLGAETWAFWGFETVIWAEKR